MSMHANMHGALTVRSAPCLACIDIGASKVDPSPSLCTLTGEAQTKLSVHSWTKSSPRACPLKPKVHHLVAEYKRSPT